jgi:hypothetical protein
MIMEVLERDGPALCSSGMRQCAKRYHRHETCPRLTNKPKDIP